jgi:large subunit ribosomal protein L31
MDLLLRLDLLGAKENDTLKLEIDPKSHPAWTGGKANINESEGQVARFQKRFKGLKV